MPKQAQPLTQLQVRNAKAKEKPYKLAPYCYFVAALSLTQPHTCR